MSHYKLDDWIEPYLSEDGNSYIIPTYKINRLKGIEDENEILKECVKYYAEAFHYSEFIDPREDYDEFNSGKRARAALEKIKALNKKEG